MGFFPKPLGFVRALPSGLVVSPRATIIAVDTANQTILAGVSSLISFDSTVTGFFAFGSGGLDLTLRVDQALLIEDAAASLTNVDASNQLAISYVLLQAKARPQSGLPLGSVLTAGLPYQFESVAHAMVTVGRGLPFAVYAADTTMLQTGLIAGFLVHNTDASNPHTYRRTLWLSYRIVSGIDTTGPATFTA